MSDCFFKSVRLVLLMVVSLMLTACLSDTSYAPIVNADHKPVAKPKFYTVRKGDTVYSIAWTLGLDYRMIAAANGLKPPYAINPGQQLRLQEPLESQPTIASSTPSTPKKRSGQERVVRVYNAQSQKVQSVVFKNLPVSHWIWPARGRVADGFSPKLAGNRGLDIAGYLGEPIKAAASGQVVYSGDGVRGYGNLLIIKHNDSYLSAYAFNRKLLVGLGQHVQAGQTIAKMGRDNAGKVMLHFEIRKNGKPVNPALYLNG